MGVELTPFSARRSRQSFENLAAKFLREKT
jgi:hypothetical protein